VTFDDIAIFLEYFESVRGRTLRIIRHIPRDRLEWAPTEDRFTFGDLIRHIGATERYMFAENARGEPSRYPGHGRELAEGWDDVLAFLDRMHTEAVEILSRLTSEDLVGKSTTPGGAPITTWKWLRAMVEHEVHHRGQIYMMLALLGVAAPPLYGLTEAEVRQNSLPLAE
jgi:uncharacterized damage-inducible protein DinB